MLFDVLGVVLGEFRIQKRLKPLVGQSKNLSLLRQVKAIGVVPQKAIDLLPELVLSCRPVKLPVVPPAVVIVVVPALSGSSGKKAAFSSCDQVTRLPDCTTFNYGFLR
jgi:hypothetical protein